MQTHPHEQMHMQTNVDIHTKSVPKDFGVVYQSLKNGSIYGT